MKEPFRHQPSYAALVTSAQYGCQMCWILLDAHLGYYEEHPEIACTRQVAHDLSIYLDQKDHHPFYLQRKDKEQHDRDSQGVYGFKLYRVKPGNRVHDESGQAGYLEHMLHRLSTLGVGSMVPPSLYGGAQFVLEAPNGE